MKHTTESYKMSIFKDIVSFLGRMKANQTISISQLDDYIWFRNPKVAGTSLDFTLQSLQVRSMKSVKITRHPPLNQAVHTKPYQLSPKLLDHLLTSGEYLRFCFVREPSVRLVSAYRDKIVGGAPEKKLVLKTLGYDGLDLSVDVSFDAFVGLVCDTPHANANRHWMPQVYTTCAHWIDLDFVGRLESFQNDLDMLAQRMGANLGKFYQHRAPHKTGASLESSELTPELRRKIRDYYELDYEKFYPNQ
ncbi:MAG: sulfotransferase family protein [Pseudomonadota bacterium]